VNNQIDKSEIQRTHFNNIKNEYSIARSNKNHLAYKRVWWDYVKNAILSLDNFSNPKLGLEAMCGLGEGANILKEIYPFIEILGFDYSDEMVKECKIKNKNLKNVIHMDILKFNEINKFDIIILLGGLHHVPDSVELALTNIFNALKHNGVLINLEPTHNNFLFKKIRERIYKKNMIFEENSEKGFELLEYNKLLIQSGFKIRKQFYPGLMGYVLFYNPDAFPFLNKGSSSLASFLSKVDWILGKTFLGRKFSFATWSIAVKE
jgi:SAM-dependent methyltransferase